MADTGSAVQEFWSRWPVLALPALSAERRQDALEGTKIDLARLAKSSVAPAAAKMEDGQNVVLPNGRTGADEEPAGCKEPDFGSFHDRTGQESASGTKVAILATLPDRNGQESACATCGGPVVGRRRGAKFCSDGCRVKAAGAAFRQRKTAAGSAKSVDRSSRQIGDLNDRKTAAESALVLPGKSESRRNGGLRNPRRISDNAAERLESGQNGPLPNRRCISDSAAIVHPGEVQRPFRTDESEPSWLSDELAPPALDCEQPEPEAPTAARLQLFYSPVKPAAD